MPLGFEVNQGQFNPTIKFAARGPGYQIALTANEALLRLRKPASRAPHAAMRDSQFALVRMKLVNANPAPDAAGLEELPGKVNYFTGKDPKQWREGVVTYAKVKYQEVYRGIDLVYYGNQRQLEYDLIVAPGADPRVIRLAFDGVGPMRVDAKGELTLPAAGGELRQRAPVVYQESAAGRKNIVGRFVLTGEREAGFEIGPYDTSRPLVIDPVLAYSTYLGGSFGEYPGGIAVDAAGAAYVTGQSESFDFPGITPLNGNRGIYKTTNSGGSWNSSGAGLTTPNVQALAIDPSTPATVYAGTNNGVFKSTDSGANWTSSNTGISDFPFIRDVVISPTSPSILYAAVSAFPTNSVYKSMNGGGNWTAVDTGLPSERYLQDLAIDPANASTVYAVVADSTTSRIFKTTDGGANWNLANSGITNYVIKLAIDPANTSTLYAATIDGVFKSTDGGASWNLSNNGLTNLAFDFAINPASPSTIHAACTDGVFKSTNGGADWSPVNAGLPANAGADVMAINPISPTTLYASIFDNATFNRIGLFKTTDGGSSWSPANSGVMSNNIQALAVNPVNPAIVYAGASGDTLAFAAKLNPAGSALLYSTYLGGNGYASGLDIAVDSGGNAYLTGGASFNFPTTPGAYFSGFGSSFAVKLNASGVLAYSTLIPDGDGFTSSDAISTDSTGKMYLAGYTSATDFPTTPGAYRSAANGGTCNPPFNDPCNDGFFMKLNPAGGGASDLQYSTYLGGNQDDFPTDVAVDGMGRVAIVGYTNSTNFPATAGAYQTIFGGGDCPDFPCTDVFVSRLNPAGGGALDLQYSTYLGGSGYDFADGVAVDGTGKIYVTGSTQTTNFPTTPGAYQTACAGSTCGDAFVAKLDPAAAGAASLLYSSYFGGSEFEGGSGIAVDAMGIACISGNTGSANFPVTPGAPQSTPGGGSCGNFPCSDAFAARFNPSLSGAASLLFSTYLGGSGSDYAAGIAVDAAGDAYVIGGTSATNFPTVNPIQTNQPVDDVFVTKICLCPGVIAYEADVAPRPNGSGSVVVSDWVQIGRFSVGLDTPGQGSETRRADCAPRGTLGDGRITVADWVQAGRYSVGLDPLTIAGGPAQITTVLPGNRKWLETPRDLRIANQVLAPGQDVVSVPVELVAQGGENALTFSLSYDPSQVSYLGFVAGQDAKAAEVLAKVELAKAGQVGFGIALRPGASFSGGAREILILQFKVLMSAGAAEIKLEDGITPLGLADIVAGKLSVRAASGVIQTRIFCARNCT